eukprot:c20582_g2_i2.p1 GENE.c20582_g2_i2~~c20582_g2_i2.p1  ORF type:complete len:282 (+),score=48.64 c20582_g2_i2:40-846(+)
MGKHAQNNTARSFHTHAERKMAGYGTQKIRLGTDSQIKFGYCALSLTPADNPVATPDGIIYSRDSIIEFLAEHAIALKTQQQLYEKQERKRKSDELAEEEAAKRQKIKDFEDEETKIAVAPQLQRELSNKTEDKVTVGFWVPLHAPTAEATKLTPPPKHTLCPTTNKPLRLKDLIPIKLEWELDDHGNRKYVQCAVSHKSIINQKAVVLKPSGVVMLASCLKDVVEPTMTCPVTGKALKKRDIVSLVPGGTGFAAHNSVEASTYCPNI